MKYDCLIVDDEKELALSTSEYFNMFDVNTDVSFSVSSAKEKLNQNEYKLDMIYVIY